MKKSKGLGFYISIGNKWGGFFIETGNMVGLRIVLGWVAIDFALYDIDWLLGAMSREIDERYKDG